MADVLAYMRLIPRDNSEPLSLSANCSFSQQNYRISLVIIQRGPLFWNAIITIWNYIVEGRKNVGSKSEDLFLSPESCTFFDSVMSGSYILPFPFL